MDLIINFFATYSLENIIKITSWILIFYGCFLLITSSIGMLRMPDLYTNFHASSITDSLGMPVMLLGIALQYNFSMETYKIIFLAILLYFINPTATYALAKAAFESGQTPVTKTKEQQPSND